MGLRAWLGGAFGIAWPMGGVLSGSLLIAWATEVLAFFLSRGLAFAVLAFLQVLPEFAVEAVITYSAAKDPEQLQYVSANFTGANRLIVGLFLPMVFFVAALKARRNGRGKLAAIELPALSSVEVLALLTATVYSFSIPLRGELHVFDSVALFALYGTYLWMVYRLPPSEEASEALPVVARNIRTQPEVRQKQIVALFLLAGGALLFVSVEPFYRNTLELAGVLGISAYFLVQWLAPMLSEFPEFITILYWGKTGREQLGLTNAVSSKVNQWTLLLSMVAVIYLYGTWRQGSAAWAVPFDDVQRVEILLTAAQGLFAAACLVNLRFERWEAWALLLLWGTQLLDPLLDEAIDAYLPAVAWSPFGTGEYIREWYVFVYLAFTAFIVVRARGRLRAFPAFAAAWREHIRPGTGRGVAGAARGAPAASVRQVSA